MQMWLDLKLFKIGSFHRVKRAKDFKKTGLSILYTKNFSALAWVPKNIVMKKKKKKRGVKKIFFQYKKILYCLKQNSIRCAVYGCSNN